MMRSGPAGRAPGAQSYESRACTAGLRPPPSGGVRAPRQPPQGSKAANARVLHGAERLVQGLRQTRTARGWSHRGIPERPGQAHAASACCEALRCAPLRHGATQNQRGAPVAPRAQAPCATPSEHVGGLQSTSGVRGSLASRASCRPMAAHAWSLSCHPESGGRARRCVARTRRPAQPRLFTAAARRTGRGESRLV